MVNNVINKPNVISAISAKTQQAPSAGNAFQDILASINNFDLTSTKLVPDAQSFNIGNAAVKEKAPETSREKEVNQSRESRNAKDEKDVKSNDRAEKANEKKRNRDMAQDAMNIADAQVVAPEQTQQVEITDIQDKTANIKEAINPDLAKGASLKDPRTMAVNAADMKNAPKAVDENADAAKIQTAEVAAQPVASEAMKKAEVQQGQAAATNVADNSSKRTVNILETSRSLEKIDDKAIQNAEQGNGKNGAEGEEKSFGGNQQKDDSLLKAGQSNSTLANSLSNTLKQPSFKESIDRALKVEAKAADAVATQTSQSNQKTTEARTILGENLHKPKEAAKFAQGIGDSLKNMKFNPGRNEITIRIDPPHLGKLKISVNVEQGGKISTSIVAENQAVKNALESNMNHLRGSLEESGLKLENLTVTVDEGRRENANLAFGDRKNNGGEHSADNNRKTMQSLDEAEIEKYVNLSNYRADSKGIHFVSTVA